MLIFIITPYPLESEMIGMLISRMSLQVRVIPVERLNHLNGLIMRNGQADFVIIDPQVIDFFGAFGREYIHEHLPNSKIVFITDLDAGIDSIFYFHKQEGVSVINKRDKASRIYMELNNLLSSGSCKEFNAETKPNIIKISKRHRQLISLLDRGLTNQEMALQLGISEHTVKVHFFRLNKILGTKNRLQVLNFAKSNGWMVNL
jgi:DNA-binding NarL/FixJ family response regulator